MGPDRTLEQSIAVFGESGSGKTVLLSSFYGAAQEPRFLRESPFAVIADDIGQGSRLHRNYLGMRDSARLPEATRFTPTTYSFALKLKSNPDPSKARRQPYDALRLVWHDYPGEWFEQAVSGPEEARRRVDTFRTLLSSNVALLLVDGQRLLAHAGEEERYLKSLFSNFRNGLLALRDGVLPDGQPLTQFPRIWVLALSKADLVPNLDVFAFRDLLVDKAGEDIQELRGALASFVESPTALSMGEDFIRLSSGHFEVDRIEVTRRVGLDLIVPVAATLPMERMARWSSMKLVPRQVAVSLVANGGPVAQVLAQSVLSRTALAIRLARIPAMRSFDVSDSFDKAANLAGNRLKSMNADALSRHNYLIATLTGFRLALDTGEEEHVFLRSRR